MNIYRIEIKNYKSIKDSGEIEIDDRIMAFIGQNNAGKSAILDAIQCVFPSTKKIVNKSDFHKGTHDNIEICIWLNDVTDEYLEEKLFADTIAKLLDMSELDLSVLLDESDVFVEFKGALTEQFVLQQLVSDTSYTPFYYGNENARFEQDFIVQKHNGVVPIEVKASTNVRSQSLKSFCDEFKPQEAIRFSLLNYKKQEWMTNYPLYAVCCIE